MICLLLESRSGNRWAVFYLLVFLLFFFFESSERGTGRKKRGKRGGQGRRKRYGEGGETEIERACVCACVPACLPARVSATRPGRGARQMISTCDADCIQLH